jgi:hypothetical protein
MNACPYPSRPARRLLTLLLLSAIPFIGCGGNVIVDHGGDTSGSGDGGSSGSVGSGPPSMNGTPTVACKVTTSGLTECIQVFDTAAASTIRQGCSEMQGNLISACPAQGALGCCTISESSVVFEQCIYSEVTAPEFEKACHAERGTFSASP